MATLQTDNLSQPQGALGETLARVATRVQAQRHLRGGARGLAAALVLDIVLAALSRAALLPGGPAFFLALLILAVAGVCAGVYFASRSALSLMDAARLAEARLPLKERLSSALEFDAAAHSHPLLALQHADADSHARALDAQAAVPRRVPREAWLAAALLLALALILWLPFLPFGPTLAQGAERGTVQAAGRQLVQAARLAERQADAQHDMAAKRQAQKMQTLGKRMAEGHLDRAQSLAAVSEQERQLAQSSPPSPPSDPGQAAQSLAGANGSPVPSPQSGAAPAKSAPGTPAPSRPGEAGQTQSSPQNPSSLGSQPGAQAGHPPMSPAKAHNGTAPVAPNPAPGGARAGTSKTSGDTSGAHSASKPSAPARAGQGNTNAGQRSVSASPSAGASPSRQALEDARHQLAGAGPSSPPPSGQPVSQGKSPPPSAPHSKGRDGQPSGAAKPGQGASSHPGSAKSASQGASGKPGAQGQQGSGKAGAEGQTGGGKAGAEGQSGGGKAGAASSPGGKAAGAQPGAGKGNSQQESRASGASGGKLGGGGGVGQGAKAPFRSALPRATPSRSQGIYLGAPRQGSGQGQTLHTQTGLPAAPAGASRVPYGAALPRYRKGAEAALDQEQVPPSQRAVVRDYFNSLQPAK